MNAFIEFRRTVLKIAVVFAVAGLAACGRGGKPDPAALAGSWRLAPESLGSAAKRAGAKTADSSLELKSDGSFVASQFPDEDPFKKPEYSVLNGSGTWTVERQQTWMLTLVFDGGHGRSFYLEPRKEGGLEIVHHVGSPDSGERWAWRKAP